MGNSISRKSPRRSLRGKLRIKRKSKMKSKAEAEVVPSVPTPVPIIVPVVKEKRVEEVKEEGEESFSISALGIPIRSANNPSTPSLAPTSIAETEPGTPQCYCGINIGRDAHPIHKERPICSRCERCQVCIGAPLKKLFLHCYPCSTKLLSLPIELIQEIASHLDTNSTWLFRLTCKSLFHSISALTNPREIANPHPFFKLIRNMVPRGQKYCRECVQYHYFAQDSHAYRGTRPSMIRTSHCKRYLANSVTERIKMGRAGEFICPRCHFIQSDRQCKSCARCGGCGEDYVEWKKGYNYYSYSAPIRCHECCMHRSKCWLCDCKSPTHRRCQGCAICEKCAKCLFQLGRTHCQGCGGGDVQGPSTRRVAVESGPGYEMFYYGGERRTANEPRRIGIGR